MVPAFQLVSVQLFAPLQALQQGAKCRKNRFGGDIIQGLAQGTIAGDVFNRKHGFQITVLQAILHAPLKREHGRVLKKHHRQCTHQTIMQGIIDLAFLPGIIDLFEKRRKDFSHRAEAQMFFDVHTALIAKYNPL